MAKQQVISFRPSPDVARILSSKQNASEFINHSLEFIVFAFHGSKSCDLNTDVEAIDFFLQQMRGYIYVTRRMFDRIQKENHEKSFNQRTWHAYDIAMSSFRGFLHSIAADIEHTQSKFISDGSSTFPEDYSPQSWEPIPVKDLFDE